MVFPTSSSSRAAQAPQGAQPAQPPMIRVAPVKQMSGGVAEKLSAVPESAAILHAPGDKLNLFSGQHLNTIRPQIEKPTAYLGVHDNGTGKNVVDAVPNPDSPDGKWDPYAFMPRFAFAKDEDAFPIDPTYDGDLSLDDNAPETPNGPNNHYQDGMIGGNQALSAGFAVAKKGEYTVLTYQFYYATNKALDYHKNDYSFAQVYLKPGPDGKLAPAYLATTWHYGEVLTPWKDLAKDADGRPVVAIAQGSHSTQAVARGQGLPRGGVQIAGDGQASLNGRPLGQRLAFEAFQPEVKGARLLDVNAPEAGPRLNSMGWGAAALDPFLPEVYQQGDHPVRELAARAVNGVEAQAVKAKKLGGKLVDAVKGWLS